MKEEKIKCLNPECDIVFTKKLAIHIYCCKKCYYSHLAIKKYEDKHGKPIYICPGCGKKTLLDFSPKLNEKQWLDWKCPGCGYTNETNDYYKDLSLIEKELQKEERNKRKEEKLYKTSSIFGLVVEWFTNR